VLVILQQNYYFLSCSFHLWDFVNKTGVDREVRYYFFIVVIVICYFVTHLNTQAFMSNMKITGYFHATLSHCLL